MLTTALVGLDGSAASTRVLDWCNRAFSSTTTEVVLVTCRPDYSDLGEASDAEFDREARAIVDEGCDLLSGSGVLCRGVVMVGDARAILVALADELDVDVLVVGSRGRSELADVLLGSVSTYLTHHCPRPVTVVR